MKLSSRRRVVSQPGSAFAGFRFPAEVIVLAVRWYLRYDSAAGLFLSHRQWFTQNTPHVPGANETGDHFGFALSAADFNGDHRADLAVGAPEEDLGTTLDSGAVTVLDGSSSGLTARGSGQWSLHTAGLQRAYPPNNYVGWSHFGSALAAADLTGDGDADLVVGAPSDSASDVGFEGTITVVMGASSGLTVTGSEVWSQNSPGIPGTAEIDDEFGISLCVGDFNGDGHPDVAVGAYEGIGAAGNAGDVTIIYVTHAGLTAAGAQAWSQNSTGIIGTAEPNDLFGSAVYAANIRSTTDSDLIVGIPDEDTGTYTDNGAVAFLRGGTTGITATGNQFIDGTHLESGRQSGSQLGAALT